MPVRDDTSDDREPFALLADELRLEIIRTLGTADASSLSFSVLRERVGNPDSGRFNYHLGKLTGTFVRRTDAGEYALSSAGCRVVGAIVAAEFPSGAASGPASDSTQPTPETATLESPCPRCDTAQVATYDPAVERVSIRCPDCAELRSQFGFPPGGWDAHADSLTTVLDRWFTDTLRFHADGICVNCTGRTTGRIKTDSAMYDDDELRLAFDCERCPNRVSFTLSLYLLFQPPVVAFLHDHGIDPRAIDIWNLKFVLTPTVQRVSTAPLELLAEFERDGDRLRVRVDSELRVDVVE
ncbi:hypothetical protein C483_01601 [Natrialba hulunbeirensis JCM 10989]|uniref:ArsR family transcriptional regulator n=1 Tax=Natrialba hulunbeirensis JCM 10989 TaxID=1227493 RepID=M0ACF2_9EURY|nr:helix-turn-helix transcriptional regulator [Natrialba hulunbeirensis]ELY95018.1 hypothetical protein C483_01601 [Natrialba hulunbeirensis JCM 10989]